jgi:hypothetical protein
MRVSRQAVRNTPACALEGWFEIKISPLFVFFGDKYMKSYVDIP